MRLSETRQKKKRNARQVTDPSFPQFDFDQLQLDASLHRLGSNTLLIRVRVIVSYSAASTKVNPPSTRRSSSEIDRLDFRGGIFNEVAEAGEQRYGSW